MDVSVVDARHDNLARRIDNSRGHPAGRAAGDAAGSVARPTPGSIESAVAKAPKGGWIYGEIGARVVEGARLESNFGKRHYAISVTMRYQTPRRATESRTYRQAMLLDVTP
jgi:hypothetical protein